MALIVASILWRRLDHEGHDACSLVETAEGWTLAGQASFVDEGGLLCGLRYGVTCAPDWTTRHAMIAGFVDRQPLDWRIERNVAGRWSINESHQPNLDGLIDVDLGFTPATNLIAIRRLDLGIGVSAPAPAAWFAFPELKMQRMDQTYRRVDVARYDYSGLGYRDVLKVSPQGFVIEYPGLWSAVGSH